MQKRITQDECNRRVKEQLVKLHRASPDFCEITVKALPKYQRIQFLIETFYIKDEQYFPYAYEINSNYYFSLLQNSFVAEGLPVTDCSYKVTSSETFNVYLTFVKSYAYQKKR